MPARSKLLSMPSNVLAELDDRLRTSGFSDFVGHSEWLASVGHPIGRSALHAYSMEHRVRILAGRRFARPVEPIDPVKLADQKIECLKVVAALPLCDLNATGEDLKAAASDLHQWAYEPSSP